MKKSSSITQKLPPSDSEDGVGAGATATVFSRTTSGAVLITVDDNGGCGNTTDIADGGDERESVGRETQQTVPGLKTKRGNKVHPLGASHSKSSQMEKSSMQTSSSVSAADGGKDSDTHKPKFKRCVALSFIHTLFAASGVVALLVLNVILLATSSRWPEILWATLAIEVALLCFLLVRVAGDGLYLRYTTRFYRGGTNEAPSGECTFVFTDVENSTKLFEESSRLTMKSMMLHYDVLRKVWEPLLGFPFKTEGDSVALAFQTPQQALAFCMQAQVELLHANWPPELADHGYGPVFDEICAEGTNPEPVFNGLRVRMGVATGTAMITASKLTGRPDWYGRTVNLAARCEQCAKGGQILIEQATANKLEEAGLLSASKFNKSLEQYDFSHSTKMANVAGIIRFYGQFSLKGISKDTRLFEAIPESLVGRRFFAQLTQEDIDAQIDALANQANAILFSGVDVNVAQSLKETIDFALEESLQITSSNIGYVAFVNKEQNELTMYGWSKSAMANCKLIDKPLVYPLEQTGIWGEAVRQRKHLILNDFQAPNPLKRGLPHGHVTVVRHLNVPIFYKDRIVLVAGVGQNKTGLPEYDSTTAANLTAHYEELWPRIMLLVKNELYGHSAQSPQQPTSPARCPYGHGAQ